MGADCLPRHCSRDLSTYFLNDVGHDHEMSLQLLGQCQIGQVSDRSSSEGHLFLPTDRPQRDRCCIENVHLHKKQDSDPGPRQALIPDQT